MLVYFDIIGLFISIYQKDNSVLNSEKWIKIENWSYEVSNTGKIRNLKGQILKSWLINSGYRVISLYKNGFCKKFLVHRLVAEIWLKNPKNYPEVNHKDGNKENNSVENLEWCSTSYNHKHAFKTGIRVYNKPTKGLKLLGKKKACSKYFGVGRDRARKKWIAYILKDNKFVYQKRFNTELEAAQARDSKLKELNLTNLYPLNFSDKS